MARHPLRFVTALLLPLVLGLAWAQEPADTDLPESDPPDRAARLAYISGDVSLQPAGEQDWAPALLNRPLTTGDKLWTENGARAEIQVSQSAIRLDGATGFSFLDLGDDTVQMRMTAGTMILDVRALDGREQIEIDTPNIALAILRPGSYRIEVNDAGDATTVKIGDGEAEANGPATNLLVHPGQAVTFRGVAELVADTATLGPPDDFDEWSMEREHRGERVATSRTAEYVSPEVTGYDDLDEYGTWSSEAEYGYVWTPTHVVVGWSPYRFGRWVWVSPWGWTWIDDSPWGYAPFHYGRWAHIRNRWCWVPGPRHVRAVYAPALVGWVGMRGSYVSWVPLGPRDVYVPWRRFSRHYWERVNFANARYIARSHVREVFERRGARHDYHDYRNRSVPDAITSVARASFTRAQRVGERRVRFNEREMAGHDNSARLAPARDSRFGGVVRSHPRISAATAARQVIVKREPPPVSARFARRPVGRDAAYQQPQSGQTAPPRIPRLQDRSPGAREIYADAAPRPRTDRPPHGDRQDNARSSSDSAPPARHSPSEQRTLPGRLREQSERTDRPARDDRPAREDRRERDAQTEPRNPYPQYSQQPLRTRDAVREAVARQLEQRERQSARERQVERAQPRIEQRRIEPPRSERPQPRVERTPPRLERPRAEPPRERSQPQPSRSERPNPAEPRPQRHGDGNRPSKR